MLKLIEEDIIQHLPVGLKFNWKKAFYTTSCLGYYKFKRCVGLLSWRIDNKTIFHISKFEILPDFKMNKYGSSFLKDIEEFAVELECNKVDLWVEIQTKDFYLKNNYFETGDIDFVNDCPICKMEKEVGS